MSEGTLAPGDPDPLRALLARTPARLLVGRVGPAYRTSTWLKLREDHAIARDAVDAELKLDAEFVARFGLFEVRTRAESKAEYLLRPDRGRQLSDPGRDRIRAACPAGADLQVFIGDGLSAAAVAKQVPGLLPLLAARAATRGWRFGQPFAVRYCRVGVLNDVGDLLGPTVAVLLIGERPGLATAESLSAYMAYRPRAGHTDADRNLVSNIHTQGVPVELAAARIAAMAAQMMLVRGSGFRVKEAAALPE